MQINKLLDFKFIKDIIYYDGPLISLGITQDNQPVLEVWNDMNRDENYNLYSYVFIQQEDLYPLINGEKLFYDVLKDSTTIISWKYNGQAYDFETTDVDYYLANYGPKKTVSLEKDFIDFIPAFNAFLEQDKSTNLSPIKNKKGI